MRVSVKAPGGMSLGMILFLIFLILKLCSVINWSWWWVCSPLWIPLCLAIVLFAFAAIMYVIFERK